MAKSLSFPTTLCLLLLALTLGLATSARLLDEVDPTIPLPDPTDDLPALPITSSPTTTTLPSSQAPAAAIDDTPPADEPQPNPTAAAAAGPAATTTTGTTQGGGAGGSTADEPQPDPAAGPAAAATTTGTTQVGGVGGSAVTTGTAQSGGAGGAAVTTGNAKSGGAAAATAGSGHPSLSFFMHDVLGGSRASGRIVTGIIATSDVNGIPFSRPNNQVFPVTNGVPLNNGNLNNMINNNNAPLLGSLNGQQSQSSIIQNAGTNTVVNGGSNNQAFVTPGQLPTGTTLQKLMFGSITVIDDELTEGHELGSAVIGKGQGFYLASSIDGESHTMAFTAVFHGGDHHEEVDDTISFFGVHRTASPISQLAVIGGTGKYENASGYATIETLPQQDQHTTDGVDTIAHLDVYLS